MPIKGLTDIETLKQSKEKIKIIVYKGSEREIRTKTDPKTKNPIEYPIAGHDLQTFFRIETNDDEIRELLLAYYSNQVEQDNYRQYIINLDQTVKGRIPLNEQSLFLSYLNIYLPYDEVEDTYNSEMIKYAPRSSPVKGILWKCDREKIYEKTQIVEDKGRRRRQKISCHEECPVAGTLDKCPKGCNESGILYFYIKELYMRGYRDLCAVYASGSTDLKNITGYLFKDVFQERGTVSKALHDLDNDQFIPYVLSRRKEKFNRPELNDAGDETGNFIPGYTYALSLRMEPLWLEQERTFKRIGQAQTMGFLPAQETVEAALDIRVLPPARNITAYLDWKLGEAEKTILKQKSKEYGWDVDTMTWLLQNKFDLEKPSDVEKLSKGGYETLLEYIEHEATRKEAEAACF